jgi:hypothetical protein
MVGVWLLGAGVAVALSFAAVARVASGVAPAGVGSLSRRAIDNQLRTVTSRPVDARSTTTPSTSRPTPTRPPPSVPEVPTTVPISPTIVPPPVSVAPDTVTTSQGGTLWTHCSGQSSIVYVAAIPKSGYQRTENVEASDGVSQQFENGRHRSSIEAQCSAGVVRAQVDEESAGD